MDHPEFPSDETLAAFIDGRVDLETRKRVIEHMVACNDCYATFEAAAEMREQAAPHVVAFPRRRVALIGFVAAVAAAIVVIFVAAPIRERLIHQRPKIGLTELAEAEPPQRNIEGRLTGFAYRPPAPAMRGPNANPASLKLLDMAMKVQDEAKKNPTPSNLHALGVAHLLVGNQEEAVKVLEEALKRETTVNSISKAIEKSVDAELMNDLSAAYASQQNYPRALEVAERAWQQSHSPESAWNRAIALERAQAKPRARDGWEDYLKLDASSQWAAEARRRLTNIAPD